MTVTFAAVVPSRWSYAHWSLLAYAAACLDGPLDRGRLRCNETRHPLLVDARYTTRWKDLWSTSMKNPGDKIVGHDDWDCFHDLEAAGLVDITSTIDGLIQLTTKGRAVMLKLREHKVLTGTYATFEM